MPDTYPEWDQSDGVVCPVCGDDATLCPHFTPTAEEVAKWRDEEEAALRAEYRRLILGDDDA